MTLQEKIEYWRSLHPLDLDLDSVVDTFSKEFELERKKARSIVAMLFWKWRIADRIVEQDEKMRESPICVAHVDEKRIAFELSYILLKDKK